MGTNTFRSGPHHKWVPMGPKFTTTKNFDPLGHPNPKICPIESTKKGDIIPPPVGKRGSSFEVQTYDRKVRFHRKFSEIRAVHPGF